MIALNSALAPARPAGGFATQAEACKFYGVAMVLEPSLVISVLRARGNDILERRAVATDELELAQLRREYDANMEQWKQALKLRRLRERSGFDPDDLAEIRRELRSNR